MTNTPETITVDAEEIYCDGGNSDAGHPRVFLAMNKQGFVDCPYCGRHFVLSAGGKKAAAH